MGGLGVTAEAPELSAAFYEPLAKWRVRDAPFAGAVRERANSTRDVTRLTAPPLLFG
jgi:hypothetical protein